MSFLEKVDMLKYLKKKLYSKLLVLVLNLFNDEHINLAKSMMPYAESAGADSMWASI